MHLREPKPRLHRGLSNIPESTPGETSDRSGIVIGWALRWMVLCCGIAVLAVGILNRSVPSPADPPAPPVSRTGPVSNTIVYTATVGGHVIVDAVVNGAPVRMLVDTGASLVTLTPRDARAAGIDPDRLVYSARASTANGTARMATVMLREIRIDQLSLEDLPAAVVENLNISLLGMSFLARLQSYEMHDGKLTITW